MLTPPANDNPADWAEFLRKREIVLRARRSLEAGARRRALRMLRSADQGE